MSFIFFSVAMLDIKLRMVKPLLNYIKYNIQSFKMYTFLDSACMQGDDSNSCVLSLYFWGLFSCPDTIESLKSRSIASLVTFKQK